ncbi:ferritin-like domain-containing protein [Halapricum hydrolyticum]|uniref:Ferritin-like domain-containing protein n=1 Tax=Halapricum hydrolyticum TaxID=2979991 RepID=A0AAE3I998_9EURY|nr:ferritin-like domain-containing protein [Halapricum hydrolyticum]MCU4717229.1 ferritin-like domain-containing protein [Halapricum hydrolyticum]MCU4726156.1 ferritin-like domain-containing protein [Halapricum hydrolyticum]
MSVGESLDSDHQLARLLQIGIVLEEVVEARASKHVEAVVGETAVAEYMQAAAEESARHRDKLEDLIADLDVETVPFEQIKRLVEATYEADSDFDDVLYDQLCNEETAYKFYEDLIAAIEASETEFTVSRDRLLSVLEEIREEEAEGVEAVTRLMEEQ